MDLNETRKALESCLTEEQRKDYFLLLRRWFSFKSPISKTEFDGEVRQWLINGEQIRCHNNFLLALLSKRTTNRVKSTRNTDGKGDFEWAEYSEYIQPSSPTMLPPAEYESRSAAAELFMPDSGFVATKISIATWENGLDGADDKVTEVMVYACQMFVKNIITAMTSRIKGYKIRDGKFQYGFNLPVPDPFLRNYRNVMDENEESKVEVMDDEDSFVPKLKPSLENIEQQTAFAYSCAKKQKSDNVLTVRLLYDTLKENPRILGLHDLHSVNLLKLNVQIDD